MPGSRKSGHIIICSKRMSSCIQLLAILHILQTQVLKMDQNVCGPSYIKSRKENNTTLELDHFIKPNGLVSWHRQPGQSQCTEQAFSSIFTTEDTSYLPTVHKHNIPTMHSIIISSPGVMKLLSYIKSFTIKLQAWWYFLKQCFSNCSIASNVANGFPGFIESV